MTITDEMLRFVARGFITYRNCPSGKPLSFVEYDDKYDLKYFFKTESDGICSAWTLYEYGRRVVNFNLDALETLAVLYKL